MAGPFLVLRAISLESLGDGHVGEHTVPSGPSTPGCHSLHVMDNNDPTQDRLTFWRALAIGLLIIVIVLAIYITLTPIPPHL